VVYRFLYIALVVFCLIAEIRHIGLNFPLALRGEGDFPAFYRAALMVKSGAGHNLYNAEMQQRFELLTFPAHKILTEYFYLSLAKTLSGCIINNLQTRLEIPPAITLSYV
jgi:hypothetical protein